MAINGLLKGLLFAGLCLSALASKPTIHSLSEAAAAEGDAAVGAARRNLQHYYSPYSYIPQSSSYYYPQPTQYNPYPYTTPSYNNGNSGSYSGYGYYSGYGNPYNNQYQYYNYDLEDMNEDMMKYGMYNGMYNTMPWSMMNRRQLKGEDSTEGEEEAFSPPSVTSGHKNPPMMVPGDAELFPQQMMMPPMPPMVPQQYFPSPPAYYYGYPAMPRPFPRPMPWVNRAPWTGRPFPGDFRQPPASATDALEENEDKVADQKEGEDTEQKEGENTDSQE